MKKLIVTSIVGNAALIAGMLWSHAEYKAELHESMLITMRADERYIGILARTLEAIDSPESEESETMVKFVRKLVAAGHKNREQRRRAGLGL